MRVGLRGILLAWLVSSLSLLALLAVGALRGSTDALALRLALWSLTVLASLVFLVTSVVFRRAVRMQKLRRRGFQARLSLLRDLQRYESERAASGSQNN